MTAIRAIFDGKVFVPDQPVDFPIGTAANIVVPILPDAAKANTDNSSTHPTSAADDSGEPPLMALLRMLDKVPRESSLPPDASMEVDHYLYGMPKRNSQ